MVDRPPKRIIVLRGGALGDCVVSLPSLRLLRERFPESCITLVGNPYSGPLFESSTSIDHLMMLFHRRNNIRYMLALLKLRRERPELVVDLQDGGRSRFQTAIIGGKRRIGFNTRPLVARSLFTDPVPRDKSVHVTRRISNTLLPLDVKPKADILDCELELRASDRLAADEVLRSHGLSEGFAFLQVTSGQRPDFRTWPIARFARVAEHLYDRGLQVAIVAPQGSDWVREVIEDANCPVTRISERMHALVLAAFIERADLYVGYNTGPMHLAAAVGCKIVALFDVPTDYIEWYPPTSTPCRILQAKPHPAAPGWRLDLLETDEVTTAIDSLCSERLVKVAR